jgi:hypothetical protein
VAPGLKRLRTLALKHTLPVCIIHSGVPRDRFTSALPVDNVGFYLFLKRNAWAEFYYF